MENLKEKKILMEIYAEGKGRSLLQWIDSNEDFNNCAGDPIMIRDEKEFEEKTKEILEKIQKMKKEGFYVGYSEFVFTAQKYNEDLNDYEEIFCKRYVYNYSTEELEDVV